MKSFRHLLPLISIFIMASCIAYKVNSKGDLTSDTQYACSSLQFVGRHRTVYTGIIKKQDKIQEKIVYYTDIPSSPIKVLFNYNDAGMNKYEFFISVTDDHPEFPLTEAEKQLIKIMGQKNLKDDYKQYHLIKGFRKPTSTDSIPDDIKNHK